MSLKPSDFWTWRGEVGRGKYALLGIFLFAIKYNLDRVVALRYGYRWSVFNYWEFDDRGINQLPFERAQFFAVLVLAALPFVWAGVVLTLRRLRDAGLPLWLVISFFLPFINLFFFLLLTIMPSSTSPPDRRGISSLRRALLRIVPESEVGSAAMGILVTMLLALVLTFLSVYGLADYGWGLFVGVPFFLGLNSVLVYGFHRSRTLGRCLLVSLLSVALVSIVLLALAVEGVICLMMAAPLASAVALFGGFIGYLLQQRDSFPGESARVFSLVLVALPGFLLLEHGNRHEPALYRVSTSLVVDAPAEKVWANVVAFAALPKPTERLFQAGIAYPMRAEIDGSGVGAVRHCVFSTGEFVEPIEVWDQPRLLKFGVTSQPPVMEEWSPYKHLTPPHLENYLVSRRGQFLLTQLQDGRTLLQGTTWYQNRFWPGPYWHIWSDYIIHRIHQRVLSHIKLVSESRREAR